MRRARICTNALFITTKGSRDKQRRDIEEERGERREIYK